ncbi:hypothetical protein [uncultured Ellagibacter sp.]|uniref:hypothetical protein n=1 Tax=uncultured Ellagibacter sp. TaxID=2137580 RepID=UPI00260F53D2|nr:hypothetical protein [uncultured Ellagibacter sp.]
MLGVDKGLCVQCVHIELYENEWATIDAMRVFTAKQGYAPDFSETEAQREWAGCWFFDANSPVTRLVMRS